MTEKLGCLRNDAPVLEIDRLTVGYRVADGWLEAVRDVSLEVYPGERLGVVGESGSGKSTLALAALRFLSANGAIRAGAVRLRGSDLAGLTLRDLRTVWANDVRLVPQNPLAALNPSLRIGDQVAEAIRQSAGRRMSRAEARQQAIALLRMVRVADPERVAQRYPHELSGGMQQRTLIAMALHGDPTLFVLDEPTTGLDVTTEAAVLDLLAELTKATARRATLFISHNLGVVARMCDRVAVLYAGELVEVAPSALLFTAPLHPYTAGLLDSLPRSGMRHTVRPLRPIPGAVPPPEARPAGCVFHPRCPLAIDRCRIERPPLETAGLGRQVRCHRWREVEQGVLCLDSSSSAVPSSEESANGKPILTLKGVSKQFPIRRGWTDRLAGRSPKLVRAVDGVDLCLGQGRTLGVVGESGSGKTTLARCVVGLEERTSGDIRLVDTVDIPLAPGLERRAPAVLRRIQMVFQNPQEALNPYLTVGEALRRPLMRLGGLTRDEAERRVVHLLEAVKLDASYAARYPAQLSGGERQRVAIARAFAADPDLILLDEAVSALDVSVQAAILNLLSDLRRRNGTTYLFITHDLGVVRYLADDVAVLYLGQVVEEGPVEAVLKPPMHPYTEALLSALPTLPPDPPPTRIRLEGETPAPTAIPTGCRFHNRCHRFIGPICVQEEPPWRDAGAGHRLRCHIPLEDLRTAQQGGR